MLKYKTRKVNQDSYRLMMKPNLGIEGKETEDATIIKDAEAFRPAIDAYHAQTEEFTWNITLNGSVISVSLVNDNATDIQYSYSFDYNKLKQISTTNTLWCISKEAIVSNKQDLAETDFVNMFLETYDTKIKNWASLSDAHDLKFYIPKNNCPIEDMVICIPKPLSWTEPLHPQLANSGVDPTKMGDTLLNITGDVTDIGSFESYEDLFPEITATSTVSDGLINVTVNTTLDTLYLEPEVGFLTKTKLDIVNGTGNFTVITTGLSSGETVSVKFSTKYWSDIYRFTKTI